MNGLTTIASLPSGSGSLAQQAPEVGERKVIQMRSPYFAWLNDEAEMPGVLTQEEMLALITWGYP